MTNRVRFLTSQGGSMFTAWMKLKKPKNLIGLDIDSNQIKLLKIDTHSSPSKIEVFDIAELPANAVVKSEIKDTASVATVLKNQIRKTGITQTEFALAMPRSSTIIKNITLDGRFSEADMESRVWIEAKNNFPELIGNIYLDFAILGPTEDPNILDVILVACRKEILNPYLDVLQQAGLTPKIVDVSNFVLERSLALIAKRTPEIKTVALINLDLTLSTLIVVHEGKLIYSHDESFDGARLLNQVKEFPKDSPNYFEMLKEKLSAHLRHSMHFFYSSRSHIDIQKMILSGDCAVLDNLTTYVQQEIGVDTVLADPFQDFEMSSAINQADLKKQAPALMICCGLALSEVS
jgi:type IV pilus assembly protein PilM